MSAINLQSKHTFGMPLLGFGTYRIPNNDVESAVLLALQSGYRHIDTAEIYGNEEGVGNAIRHSGLPREEIFVTTKIFPGRADWGQTEKDFASTRAAIHERLEKLQLQTIDLLLIHAPLASTRLEQWKALIQAKQDGLVRHIGVSNYNINHLQEIEAAGLEMPVINQVELHPLGQKKKLVDYMQRHKIETTAYSSLLPLPSFRDDLTVEGNHGPVLEAMASKHNVSMAQVLLRWALQQGYSILPKSTNAKRIATNADLFHFQLDTEDMQRLNALDRELAFLWGLDAGQGQEFDPTQIA